MAGKILADQIEHSTAGSVDTQFVVNGSVKAWNYATQPSATIQDSFNISSMVDVSTGIMNHVYTNSMSNGLYSGAFSLTNLSISEAFQSQDSYVTDTSGSF